MWSPGSEDGLARPLVAESPLWARVRAALIGRPRAVVRLLDTRPMRSLGSFSYSLYLTHGPIVIVVYERIVAGRVRVSGPALLRCERCSRRCS